MEDARRREVALFRYALIRAAADPALSKADRGRLVRDLAGRDHPGPHGGRVTVSRPTLDRWIRAYRAEGFAGLVPRPRSSVPRTPGEVLDLAERLKREAPARTGAHIAEVIARDRGWAPSPRTVQRHLARLGLTRLAGASGRRTFGRFEAAARNDRWTGDALHGPAVADRKAILFCFVDDHSRLAVGYRWGRADDALRMEAALRRGLACRGVPSQLYTDNGGPFVSSQLTRACAVLGIQLVHSKPGEPAGRGKIERFFATVRAQFLVEVEHRGVADIDELNTTFAAWVEQIYHRRTHRETGQTPLERFAADDDPALPSPDLLREAFLWSATRTVTKTATVSLAGNRYQVDGHLVGHRVELIFDPFDLTRLQVRLHGQPVGHAVPHVIGRHVHPDAAGHGDGNDDDQPRPTTGIDYLGLVAAEHDAATRRSINFADLTSDDHDQDTR